MATAKLWWDGSAWQTSESFWINRNTATSTNFGIYLGVQVMAFDDAVIRLEGTMYPSWGGVTVVGDAVLSYTKTLKVDGETVGTLSQGNRNVTAVVSGSVLTVTGNVATYRQIPGTPYGQPNNTNYSTTLSDPFATISFNANGGAGAPAPQTVCKGAPATLSGTVPTRANYSFLGWSTNPSAQSGAYYSGGEITVTGDTVLYAVWKANSYSLTVNKPFTATVTILKNGTAFSGATVEYGDVLTVTFTPSAGYFIDTATLNGSAISSGDTHTVTGAVTINITTVAQYSTIASFDSVVETLGTFHLTVNQYDPSHYSKVQYFDSNSVLLDTSAPFTTSTTETVPRSWFNNFPSDTQITITAVNTTYTDPACTPGTETGQTSSCTFTVTADAAMKPTLAAGCISLAPDNTGTGAINLQDQLFIKGYSKVAATFDTTKITHANGASAAAYAITVQQVTSSSASPAITSSNVLTVATDITVTYSVTDTRGRSASGTETISVYDYIGPSLQPLICKRTDSGGTEDDSGTYMTIKATANYAPLSDNAPTLTLYAKPAGGAYTSYGTITDGATTLFGGGTFSPDASYVVKVTVTDKLGNGSYLEISMPKRSWDFHIGRVNGSTGAAFGKVTEYANTLQLASGWDFRMGATTMSEAQLIQVLSGGGGGVTDVEVDGVSVVSGGVADIDLTGKSDVGHTHVSADITDLSVGLSMKLLWTNPSPSSNFAAQTLGLDLSGYDAVAIVSRQAGNTDRVSWDFALIGETIVTQVKNMASATIYGRSAEVTSSGVVFGNGYAGSTAGATNAIPVKIYGIKGIT